MEISKRKHAGVDDAPWWKKPMAFDDFTIVENDSKFSARHKQWKEYIFIGPYDSEEELKKVLDSYIKESKKHPFKQKPIKDFKTYVLEH